MKGEESGIGMVNGMIRTIALHLASLVRSISFR
jgi:hypothetical protein